MSRMRPRLYSGDPESTQAHMFDVDFLVPRTGAQAFDVDFVYCNRAGDRASAGCFTSRLACVPLFHSHGMKDLCCGTLNGSTFPNHATLHVFVSIPA